MSPAQSCLYSLHTSKRQPDFTVLQIDHQYNQIARKWSSDPGYDATWSCLSCHHARCKASAGEQAAGVPPQVRREGSGAERTATPAVSYPEKEKESRLGKRERSQQTLHCIEPAAEGAGLNHHWAPRGERDWSCKETSLAPVSFHLQQENPTC